MKHPSENQSQEVIAGLVERVTYHNVENGFSVLRAKARGHRDVVTVVGHAPTIAAGEWITASGERVNDRTHGQQFKARFLRTSPPTSADGIEKYLFVRHDPRRWPGLRQETPARVGTARAVRIYKTYGPDAIQVMTENPYRLSRNTISAMPVTSSAPIALAIPSIRLKGARCDARRPHTP